MSTERLASLFSSKKYNRIKRDRDQNSELLTIAYQSSLIHNPTISYKISATNNSTMIHQLTISHQPPPKIDESLGVNEVTRRANSGSDTETDIDDDSTLKSKKQVTKKRKIPSDDEKNKKERKTRSRDEKDVERRKMMLEKIDAMVGSHEGERLSPDTDYITAKSKLKFRCKKGHIFEKSSNCLVTNKTWCHACGTKKRSIQDMIDLAKFHGGECLSTEYVNLTSKLKWKCSKGHIFEKKPLSITAKSRWCGECAFSSMRHSIEYMREFARKFGGECLSNEYSNIREKLEWKCSNGHIFSKTYGAIAKRMCFCVVCKRISKTKK